MTIRNTYTASRASWGSARSRRSWSGRCGTDCWTTTSGTSWCDRNDRPTLLLERHLKELELPIFLRDYGTVMAARPSDQLRASSCTPLCAL